MFERIDPMSDVWTIRSWPCRRATMPTMSSTAFPNVALRSPPRVGPSFSADCSVASPSSYRTGQGAHGMCQWAVSRTRRKGITHLCQWHDREEVEGEDPHGIPLELLGDEAERDEYHEHIEPRVGQEPVEGREDVWVASLWMKCRRRSIRVRLWPLYGNEQHN